MKFPQNKGPTFDKLLRTSHTVGSCWKMDAASFPTLGSAKGRRLYLFSLFIGILYGVFGYVDFRLSLEFLGLDLELEVLGYVEDCL